MDMFKELGERISGLRDACGYEQEEFAAMLDVDLGLYRSYEEDGTDIPISVIYKIANICGVDFTEIMTGVKAKLDTYHVVKKGQGRDIDRYPGYRFQDLAFRYSGKIMQPLLVTLDPSDKPVSLVKHSGQEFNYVVSGTVCVNFDGAELILEAGDSVYFNPAYPHGQRCVGDKPAAFLTVISE